MQMKMFIHERKHVLCQIENDNHIIRYVYDMSVRTKENNMITKILNQIKWIQESHT